MNAVFPNRREAGKKLAKNLTVYANHPQATVLGLPRGGVPVAYEIAKNLNLPFDVCLVKKLGLPDHSETAMGAIAEDALFHDYSGNITIIDEDTTQYFGVDEEQIKAIAARVKAELRWLACCYRHFRPMHKIRNQIVIVADDGIATSLTMHAAVNVLRQHQPQKIIIATPVASLKAIQQLKAMADEITCLNTPRSLSAVGFWYEDFSQITDQEVCELLAQETHQTLAESC
ncbi:phosphoribosyltransferase [Pleurocapsa sp. PCC 7319]|uniref:phosphoribosyltransferase n=1 Tax=Pleurocapsa sp. PCC 7319 TaxID=118161 RepID=UPI00034C16B7|nr:phosphoribosyltransferase family protein [Pleurocapsa sp. PCC 7319]